MRTVQTPAVQTDGAAQTDRGRRSRRGVTPRAFGLGLTLALLMCAVMPYNDYYVGATYLSGNFFPIGAIGAVMLLVLAVNPLLMRLGRPQSVFSPGEIMTVWTLILVVAGIPSSGLMRYLIPHIVAPHYYANAANGWDTLIVAHLPARLIVSDPNAVRAFFQGLDRGQPVPWAAWGEPLFWWGLFVTLLFLVFFCFSALLRRQWVENERFTFPLVRLPVMLSEAPEPGQKFNALVRSPLLWLGVLLVTVLHTVKGLHLFLPTLPDPPLVWHSSDYITNKPWNGINDVEFAVYPLIIGFSYLLSSEVCLSLWLFYLLFKAEVMIGALNAWDMSGATGGICMGPAFVAFQEAGGAIMLTLWLLWAMRPHLREIWRKAVHNDPAVDDTREPLSYRFALFGLLGAYVGMYLWMTLVAGTQPTMAVSVLAGSFVIFLMLSWLVAQAGVLFMQQAFLGSQLATAVVGSAHFTAPTLAMSAITEHVGWYDAREFMMPSLLNADKAAAETGLNARSLTKALMACVALAVIVSAVASIWLPYTHGGGVALKNKWMYIDAPQAPFSATASQVHSPLPADGAAMLQMVGGGLLVLLLFVARTYIPAFGLHPAGFLVAATYPMYTLWFSLLLGWAAKAPILRYGGIRAYQLLLPLFLGLILGDCANALVWTVVGLVTGTGYALLPG